VGITRTKGGWKVVARVRINGIIRQKQVTTTGSKEQAKDLHTQLKIELREGKVSAECSLIATKIPSTFGELLDRYKDGRQFSKDHERKIERLREALGEVPPNVFPDRFRTYINLYGRDKSGSAVNRFIEIARAAYNVAVGLDIIDKNPITKWAFPKRKEVPRDVVLSPEQELELLNVIDQMHPHLGPVIRFALQVPCRRSELVNMTRADLDLLNNSIRVRNGTTKNDRGVWKPIPPNMVGYFRSLPSDCHWLFYRTTGGRRGVPIEYHSIGDFKKAWDTVRREAGVPFLRVHDTRHMSATAMVNAGTPTEVVNQVAGWRTDMLKRYYNRNPQKALDLVRFGGNCENIVKTFGDAEGEKLPKNA
jgi:integrase